MIRGPNDIPTTMPRFPFVVENDYNTLYKNRRVICPCGQHVRLYSVYSHVQSKRHISKVEALVEKRRIESLGVGIVAAA